MIDARVVWAGWAGALVVIAGIAAQPSSSAQGPGAQPPGAPPFQLPGGGPERQLVRQFDADKNGRLDLAERKAAREWLATQPVQGRGFGGRGGAPGRGAAPPAGFQPPPGFGGRGLAATSPGPRVGPADVKPAGSAPLYDTATLRTIFLEFENDDWQDELAAFYNSDVEVPATVVVDGSRYPDVGVHFRGMSSFLMVPSGSKRSLNLSVDFVNEDQRILGHRTLNLLNVFGDPTFVRGVLYAEIAGHYIQAPKANFVRVVINGESWGIYVSSEQFNADFVRDRFGTSLGARWKVPGSPFGRGGMEYLGDDAAQYKRLYEIRTRDDDRSWADLIRLFKVLNETPAESLVAALTPLLDIDGALKFLALEIALVNSDGYWARASDYNIYQDPKGRFHIVPHDINEALAEQRGFGGRGRRGGPPPGFAAGGPGGPGGAGRAGFPPMPEGGIDLDPLVGLDDASKPLRSKLLAVPELRARYLGYVRDIAERWLDWKTLGPLVERHQALIAGAVKADTRKLYTFEAFEAGVDQGDDSLRAFVERRRAFLLSRR
jgi:hypothetical protein